MAQYTIRHICDHEQVHQLYGKSSERDRKIEWLGTTLCAIRFAQKRETDNAAAALVAAEKNQSSGLPALTGSPKQIAWAETLRSAAIGLIDSEEAQLLNSLSGDLSPEVLQEVRDALALISSEPREQIEARWWIDRREPGFSRFVSTQLRERIELLCPLFSAWRDAQKEASRGS